MSASKLAVAAIVAFAAQLAASTPMPSSASAWAPVSTISSTVATADVQRLPATPNDLAPGLKSFLDKYQADAAEASNYSQKAGLHDFPSTALCTQDYPCFSVMSIALANFGSGTSLGQSQIDGLLQAVLAGGDIAFNQESNPSTILSGTKITNSALTLDVIAPAGSIPAPLLAGAVFDLFKARGLQGETDGIRGVGASNGQPSMALCVYPANADATAVTNFCHGRQLDGTVGSQAGSSVSKRSLDSLLSTFCAFIDLPLLCPSGKEH